MLRVMDSPLCLLREKLDSGSTVRGIAEVALAHSNQNATHNTYLWQSPDWTLEEANRLSSNHSDQNSRPPLFGVPVSLKDCFDLAGFPTSCGTRFYEKAHGIAPSDSAIASQLRKLGAVIVGKTHLHPLAYGITGENPEYGDCVQPRNHAWLTGGSSSGAAASVQEGSAVVAIGTDTGGSIRVPAALCGIAGFRSSVGVGSWHGGYHLAPSFDTLGLLFRDLRDGPALAQSIFEIQSVSLNCRTPAIGIVGAPFLHDCSSRVLAIYEKCAGDLRTSGACLGEIDTDFWSNSMQIFAPIQAHEAAAIHRGHFSEFEPSIAARLEWGQSISSEEIKSLGARAEVFCAQMDSVFQRFEFLIAPCAPVTELIAGADHSQARQIILRYTTPMSLAGLPVVTLPFGDSGIQLIAQRGQDAQLLAYSAYLGEKILRPR
jgi:Asp-tRNA(Asn)/Glu-tRNA(Gln) amidotransferase A subunit family amidase